MVNLLLTLLYVLVVFSMIIHLLNFLITLSSIIMKQLHPYFYPISQIILSPY